MKSRKNRGQVIIATKVGMDMGGENKGLRRDYIRRAVEKSLHRLQTDYIDLYQSHRDDEATPLAETLGAFAELITAGKVRAIGASNYSAERLSAALATSAANNLPRFQCLQPLYSLVERQPFEESLEPLCQRESLGVISYFSLASGFLTGKYRTEADLAQSPRGKSVAKYLNERGRRILSALDDLAGQLNSTPARISLAWLVARPSITAPIASTTSLDQLHDLVAATALQLGARCHRPIGCRQRLAVNSARCGSGRKRA